MKENVGRRDRIMRSIAGPAMMALGYYRWDGRDGRLGGIAAIVAGAALVESAITRVCPLNALLGYDSRSPKQRRRDLRRTMERQAAEYIEPPQMHSGHCMQPRA